jgi:hypothetical protein
MADCSAGRGSGPFASALPLAISDTSQASRFARALFHQLEV